MKKRKKEGSPYDLNNVARIRKELAKKRELDRLAERLYKERKQSYG